MANILTPDEAARVVSVENTDDRLLDVLPQVDAYINGTTGHDWIEDTEIDPEAKAAARLYLALTYDLMAMNQSQINALQRALTSSLGRLEAKAIGIQALANVNSSAYVEDMQAYIESGALGLNLIAYNRLRYAGRYGVAKALLNGRPSGGYADVSAIKVAIDAAIKAAI